MEVLNDVEVRVLGTLIEKQFATPEYYPLTLNATRLGANQKNNRNPATSYSDQEVQEALDALQRRRLVGMFHEPGSRSPKYRQFLDREFKLDQAATVLMALLMLRGPQTMGELKARSESMLALGSLAQVEESLTMLSELAPRALVTRLERQPGEREARYAQLLAGTPTPVVRMQEKSELEQRVEALEAEVRELRRLIEQLS